MDQEPLAVDKFWFGLPYQRWTSFIRYCPLDDLKSVAIPILAIHGVEDINSPVESSRYLQAEFQRLGKTNLTYLECPDSGTPLHPPLS